MSSAYVGPPALGFAWLIDDMFWFLSFCYVAIACVKFYKARKFANLPPDADALKKGALFFLLAGAALFEVPFINRAMQEGLSNGEFVPPNPGDPLYQSLGGAFRHAFWDLKIFFSIVYLCAIPFPWVMMRYFQGWHPYRVSAVIGIIILAGYPFFLFIMNLPNNYFG